MGKIIMYEEKQVGRNKKRFAVEGKTLFEVVMEAKKLSFDDITKCGLCGHDDLELSAHSTPEDGFEYVYIRCKKCRATLNFGQQKKNKEIYYLRTTEITEGQYKGQKAYDWKAYVPEQKNQ